MTFNLVILSHNSDLLRIASKYILYIYILTIVKRKVWIVRWAIIIKSRSLINFIKNVLKFVAQKILWDISSEFWGEKDWTVRLKKKSQLPFFIVFIPWLVSNSFKRYSLRHLLAKRTNRWTILFCVNRFKRLDSRWIQIPTAKAREAAACKG